jgi:hypothetical protein
MLAVAILLGRRHPAVATPASGQKAAFRKMYAFEVNRIFQFLESFEI